MESFHRNLPERKSIRLKDFDYTEAGAYFITINTFHRMKLFGNIDAGIVSLSPLGEIAKAEWLKLEVRFKGIFLDEFIIMPDHVHAIIFLPGNNSPYAGENESFSHPVKGSLGTIIRSYKASVTVRGQHLLKKNCSIWQRNYYEEIIEDDEKLDNIREYIHFNASK